jgi:hypothetical protein
LFELSRRTRDDKGTFGGFAIFEFGSSFGKEGGTFGFLIESHFDEQSVLLRKHFLFDDQTIRRTWVGHRFGAKKGLHEIKQDSETDEGSQHPKNGGTGFGGCFRRRHDRNQRVKTTS